MTRAMASALLSSRFTQVVFVVRDITAAETFFGETIGVRRLWKLEHLRAQDVEGTYQGQPGDWVMHLYLAYAKDTQIELIQPVAGRSIFQDFLDQRGEGVQHLAYVVANSAYEQAAAHLTGHGHPLIQGCRIPEATVGYFDTTAAGWPPK